MSPYQLGEWTGRLILVLAAVWLGTRPWRIPRSEGMDAGQLATLTRQRSRLVRRSILAVAALWILANIVIDIWS